MIIEFNNVIPKPMSDSVKESDIWLSFFQFQPKELYQVVAPSGTGKTSLVHTLFGKRKDYNGTILFDNQDISKFTMEHWSQVWQSKLSIVFQGLHLFPELTIVENIQIKNKLTNHKSTVDIEMLIQKFGLEPHLQKPAAILSYGQQQRVAIIRALCQPFECILLDEPFSHLDNANASICMGILEEEIDARNASAIITSLEKHNYSNKQYVLNL